LIVVNEEGKAVGSLTDGDVRRGLIAGKSLNAEVLSFCNTNFKSGRVGETKLNVLKLNELNELNKFLPILDSENRVVDVLQRNDLQCKVNTALIMAGGFGIRLNELTKDTPKPLVMVNGEPMIEHIMSNVENSGVSKVFIATHYLGDKIVEYFERRANLVEIEFLHEHTPLGTAGALTLLLDRTPDNYILVANCDVVTDLDLRGLLSGFSNSPSDVLVTVVKHELEVPFGVVRLSGSGDFNGIVEKPKTHSYIASGVNIVSRDVIKMAPFGEKLDMPELINRAHKFGLTVRLYPLYEDWSI
jgi:NDP-sugar pyrophosphorylase family protein